jgi:hypothetical protein
MRPESATVTAISLSIRCTTNLNMFPHQKHSALELGTHPGRGMRMKIKRLSVHIPVKNRTVENNDTYAAPQ